MTRTDTHLSELLAEHDQADLSRSIAEAVLQLMMEADVDGLIGAGRRDRADGGTAWRKGHRDRTLDTRLGTLDLKVPRLRQGRYFPGVLEARKTSEQALIAVIREAWISGVSARKVDDPVQAMGRGRRDPPGLRTAGPHPCRRDMASGGGSGSPPPAQALRSDGCLRTRCAGLHGLPAPAPHQAA